MCYNAACDPGSRFQVLQETNDVAIVGDCRKHGHADHEYGDIAVIQYNKKNDGMASARRWAALPAQGDGAHRREWGTGKFPWLNPSNTTSINCVRCHDNGPFIRSPYLAQNCAMNQRTAPRHQSGRCLRIKRLSLEPDITHVVRRQRLPVVENIRLIDHRCRQRVPGLPLAVSVSPTVLTTSAVERRRTLR